MQVLYIGVVIVRGLIKNDGNSCSALSLLLFSVSSISTDSRAMLGLHSWIISDAVCHTDHHQFKIIQQNGKSEWKQTGISLIPASCDFSWDIRCPSWSVSTGGEPARWQAASTGSRGEFRVCRGNRACDQFMGGKSQSYFGGCIWPCGFP